MVLEKMMNNQLKKLLTWFSNAVKTIPLVQVIVASVVTFIAAMAINTSMAEKREQQYLAEMRAFEEQTKVATEYADSVKKQSLIHERNADRATARANAAEREANRSKKKTDELRGDLDSLRETITDSTEMARIIIPKQDSIIEQQSVTIETQDRQIVFLNTALTQKDTALMLSNQRGDSLQRVVNNIPVPPKPPLFPRLTRKTVFIGGVITGIVLKVFVFK